MSDLLTPWRVKKLPDDSFAYLVPDAEIRADAGKMAVRVVVSTQTLDRERDILISKGCDTSDHKRNPIALVNHRKDWPGIAQAQDPAGQYTVKALDDRVEAVNYFHQSNKLALQAFRLVESGALRGVSPGFLTVPGAVHKVKAADGHDAFVYQQWRLVEISHCPIGMNPDALVVAVEKGFGGEALLPELKELLLPFVPEKKAQVTGGWEEKSLEDDLDIPEVTDLADEAAAPLTPSTQFYHAVYQKALDFSGLVNELRATQESEPTKAASTTILSYLGGIIKACETGHEAHTKNYPGQPGLPNADDGDIAPETMSEWRVKAMEKWDEYKRGLKLAVAAENTADIKEAVAFLTAIVKDKTLASHTRAVAKSFVRRLSNVRMVKLPSEEDEWGEVMAKLTAGA